MKDNIKRKLDSIDELFPPERLSKSKSRWENMWNGEIPEDRYPYLMEGFMPFNPYNINHNQQDRLEAYLDSCIIKGKLNDDFIPSIFPGCNQATIPTMFGATPIKMGLSTSCEKLIYGYEDINNLPEPSLGTDTIAYHWLQMQDYLVNETQGRIPVCVCDMQGPLDVCGQIWNYEELFLCAYDNPILFEILVDKVSRAFIELWNAQKRICGDNFLGTHYLDWVPKNNGATLSADSLVMISPSFYEQFYKPSFEKMGMELNGLYVHSCGSLGGIIKKICQTKHVKAIQSGQMSLRELVDAGLNNSTYASIYTNVDELKDDMKLIRENQLGVCMQIYSKYNLYNCLNEKQWNDFYKEECKIKDTLKV